MKRLSLFALLPLVLSACGGSGPTLTSREKFICTQCHGLPFPDKHSAAEWPNVIARMQAHMQANGKTMPTPQEQEEILKFYQSKAGR
jgi:hypothetical protein